MESYRAQLQAKLSWKFVQMTQTSPLHKWIATENYKPVILELVASKLNGPQYGKGP